MRLWFAVAFLTVAVVWGCFQWRSLWSGKALALHEESTSGWFGGGESLRRAFVRTTPLAFVLLACLLVALVGDELSGRLDGSAGAAAFGVSRAAAVGLLVAMALDVSVTLVNRPKAVVPPAYREDAGVLVQWWRSRRSARSGEADSGSADSRPRR